MSDWSLEACTSLLSSKKDVINYTYKHDTLGQTSYIDYFLLSSKLFCNICDFDIFDSPSPVNMSDHNPVIISINLGNQYSSSNIPIIEDNGIETLKHYFLH